MAFNATSGIAAFSLSDQFESSAGAAYASRMLRDADLEIGGDQAFGHGLEQATGMGAAVYMPTVSPLQSTLESISGGIIGGPQPTAQESGPDMQANLQRELHSQLNEQKGWKPTDLLNNNKAASNTVQNRQEGDAKLANAEQNIAALKSNVQDITRKMDQGAAANPTQGLSQGAQGAASPGSQNPSMLGSLTGGLVRDAAVAGGLTALGMPFAAAAYSAASLAVSVTGRGTLGMANSGEFTKPASLTRKGKTLDPGYGRSEAPPPQQQPGASSPQPSSSAALWDKMSQGPGFGGERSRKISTADTDLAGQSLTGITALKLVDNSPAMTSYLAQRMNGQDVHDIHVARNNKGIVADNGNISRALSIGLPDSALTQRAVLPGMHI